MDALISLDEVRKSYGQGAARVVAVDGVTLTLRRGEFIAIMGASGSGKSTLLSMAGTLEVPTTGSVHLGGVDLSAQSLKQLSRLRRRMIGFVFQDFNLLPMLSALENVSLPLELDGWRLRDARTAAERALDEVGLADLGERYPDDLSGGQRQRVAIARATVGSREVILADEPTGALDSDTGDMILAILRQRVDAGAGALVVTHDARYAAWADRVVFLRDGKVVDESRPEDLSVASLTLGEEE
jgi:putative ABC transport system ATP-binding protein